jgi:ATP-dependent DNA helicase RecG
MGTGIEDMIRRCREAGLPEPEFAITDGFVNTVRRKPESSLVNQPESRPESLEARVPGLLETGPLSKAELTSQLGQKEISGQLNKIIRFLLADQKVEQTIPGKPNSRLQKYRITPQDIHGH